MSTASTIRVTRHAVNPAIVTLEINRPDARNALSLAVISEFESALAEIAIDESIRVLILAGAGKSFCAGPARAMLLAGGTMSGAEGFARGLATHLATLEELDATCDALALRLAKGGPNAIAATKNWLAQLDGSYEDATILEAAEISAHLIAGEEAQARLRSLWKS